MKTKNQSLLAGIRFLACTFLVYLLGVGLGNLSRNRKPLFAKAPEMTIVSHEITAKNDAIIEKTKQTNESKAIQTETLLLNEVASKTISYAPGNAIAKYNSSKLRRQRQLMSLSSFASPTVDNISYGKPPRSDMIDLNTS